MRKNMWATKGRIGRGVFWRRCLVAMLPFVIALLVCKKNVEIDGPFLAILASVLVQVTSLSFIIIQAAKRMHDVSRSVLVFFIPVYGFVAALTAGTAGANRFGDRPG